MPRQLALYRGRYPGRAAFDTGLSRALLHRADRAEPGQGVESLRLYQPDEVVAFSVLDRTRAGFPAALAAARESGFEPVLRLAGGRAALFHAETLAFAWTVPHPRARDDIAARFDRLAGAVARALTSLGVDARVGAVPGEYCPGDHSVNAGGRVKLMGVGQRVVRGAAHVGGVLVVANADRVREGLVPVYRELDLDWRPESAGSVADEIGAISRQDVADALLTALAEALDASFDDAEPDAETLELAARLAPEHRAEAAPPRLTPLDPGGKGLGPPS